MVATAFAGDMDTFPKYLLRNAERLGDRPAMRHKDFGIWQSWTWREQLEEVRKFALGLQALGLGRGDRIAVIGANRPRLYWTFAAAQSLGAVPVPVYADAVADEMAYVLDHAGVRFAVVQDQEQVDKIRSCAAKIPDLTDVIYDESRGLAGYPRAGLHAFSDVQAIGDQAEPSTGHAWEDAVRAASGEDICVILYTSGTTGRSKGVMLKAASAVNAARDTVAFDKLTERDSVLAYLPLAWVGDHYLNYAQGYVAGLCMNCPESTDTVPQDLREIGPSFYFAPPRIFEAVADQRHHPHGGRRLAEAEAVRAFHRCGQAARRGHPRGTAGAAVRPAVLCARRGSDLRPAEERAWLLQHPRRLHGRRSDRAGSLLLLPLARHQPEATLRPDRSLPLCDLPEGWRRARRHGRAGRAQRRHPDIW